MLGKIQLNESWSENRGSQGVRRKESSKDSDGGKKEGVMSEGRQLQAEPKP